MDSRTEDEERLLQSRRQPIGTSSAENGYLPRASPALSASQILSRTHFLATCGRPGRAIRTANMFYDLNIPWSPTDPNLSRTLAFSHELGYSVVALNHSLSGKLPADLTSPIPAPLSAKDVPPKLTILRRVTLSLTESYQNARLTALAKEYDILALRPIDERTLQLACSSLDCDIISIDLTQRLPYFFKYKIIGEAIKSGKRFEICYSQGILGDAQARRNLISNATQLIRASRGRGLLISSDSRAGAVGLRGPWDAINLASIWGLGQERGHEAIGKEARTVVVSAKLKRTSYRGVVDVVYGGEKPPPTEKEVQAKAEKGKQAQKRKADAIDSPAKDGDESSEKPISKRQAKKRAHEARLQAAASMNGAATPSTEAPAGD